MKNNMETGIAICGQVSKMGEANRFRQVVYSITEAKYSKIYYWLSHTSVPPLITEKKVNRGKRWVCLYFRSGYKIWSKVYFPGKLIKMELSVVKILPCIRNYAKCFMDVFWFKVVIIILILQLTVMKRFIRLLVKLKPRCFLYSMVPPNHD